MRLLLADLIDIKLLLFALFPVLINVLLDLGMDFLLKITTTAIAASVKKAM